VEGGKEGQGKEGEEAGFGEIGDRPDGGGKEKERRQGLVGEENKAVTRQE
jgi:hypothetical protein